MPEAVIEGTKKHIAKVAKCKVSDVGDNKRLAEDLKLRSINRIELAALLEDTFGVKITNREILRAKTVSDVITLVQSKS